MKIGILTFWWSQDNYGQLLQCYALQQYLCNLGHDVFLIRYDLFSDILPKNKLTFIKQKVKYFYAQIKYYKSINERKFDEFRKKYLTLSDIKYK